MRIGLDLDNTIACYDDAFLRLGKEAGLPSEAVLKGKLGIRDYLRSQGREREWTIMQGVAYGSRMDEAKPFPGVVEFIHLAGKQGHPVFIISHRTKTPILGEAYDLHEAARRWLHNAGVGSSETVFLEETVESKVDRIRRLACDLFVDDLPEFLSRPDMPNHIRKVCFSPKTDRPPPGIEFLNEWNVAHSLLLGI